MKFARYVFLIAGIYGLAALVPQYFLEAKTSADYPPAITHPEFFYGFVGVGVAFQLVFLVISRDPSRFRPLMLPSVVEKFSFAFAVYALFAAGRVHAVVTALATVDLVLGILFIAAWLRTPEPRSGAGN